MIQNRDELVDSPVHELALDCVEAGISAARPDVVVREHVTLDGDTLDVAGETFDLGDYDEVVVLGGGNAAAHVAAALEAVLGDRLADGVVVTDDPVETDVVEVLPGDHPVPSERGVDSTERLLDAARRTDDETLVLAVVTGGGSALMAAPAPGISLADLQETTDALLASGATIHEVNAVRKHLSAVKGGQLARTLAPARVATLVFSDVVGNDLDVIASGPTVPDTSTFRDALDVLDDYDVEVPEAVRERLELGARGEHDETPGERSAPEPRVAPLDETPGEDDPIFERVSTHVLADGLTALEAAADVAAEAGYDPLILSSRVRGEAREAAKTHVAVAEECAGTGLPTYPPVAVVAGGETTVTVRGEGGEGGPNQEFAVSAGLELSEELGVLASVDTDGIDGATDAAGALVDGPFDDRRAARNALKENDVYPFLADEGALVETGATGTNVNDLRIFLVPEQ
ncbi:glycerate kinase type-2 family protein [Halospeciosus flavus]|uniref:Glycerate kinase n=1 Tax=Halospeciosus flavus TaxID=3032283 RepID=A0ABD5Z521_9EURY|nr:DUF4147 domain-containing protein [Halospeciosus flavus]